MLNSIKKVPAYYVHKDLRLSIEQQTLRDGKEGCARETQEGCPAPLES